MRGVAGRCCARRDRRQSGARARPVPRAIGIPTNRPSLGRTLAARALDEVPEAGGTSLEVAAIPSGVEVDEVWVRDGRVTLSGALAGSADGSSARGGVLVARERDGDKEVLGETTLDSRGFCAALDLSALAGADLPATEFWDLYLRVDGIGDLRLGRHLDDIPKKKDVLVYPPATLGEGRARRRLQPYYTTHNNLSIRSKAAPPQERSGVAEKAPEKEAGGRELRRRDRMLLWLVSHIRRLALWFLAAAANRRSAAAPLSPGERTKISFVIMHAYGMGGTIRTVLNLAGYLAGEHEVEVISVFRKRREPFFRFPRHVNVTALDDHTVELGSIRGSMRRLLRRVPSVLMHPEDYAFSSSSLWTDVVLARKLWSLPPGVLITTRPALNLIAATLAPRRVLTVGQEHLNLRAHKPGLAADITRRYPKLDALAVLTPDDLRDYGKLLAAPSARIVRIPNALPELEGDPSPLSNPLVVAAGRLTPQKGFDLLIRAFARVVERHPDWKLRIYGSGQKLNTLRTLIFEHQLYNNVVLMGRTDELGLELSKASVFALSSRFEGLPMVLLEAMSKGVAVVSFDCPTGPRQVITNGRDGLLVPNGDTEAFAAALLDLIEDEDKRRRLGAAALETARRYDLEAIGRQWADFVHELGATTAREANAGDLHEVS